MSKIPVQNYVKVRQEEYARLKNLQKRFEVFWNYITHLRDIKDAREDIKKGKAVPQEKLFKNLGL